MHSYLLKNFILVKKWVLQSTSTPPRGEASSPSKDPTNPSIVHLIARKARELKKTLELT
jgi:hypothetical protein